MSRFLGSVATARLIAIVTGVLGFLLAVLVPVLPVRQDVASIDWPQADKGSVEAPLVSYMPLSFSATIPCEAAKRLPGGSGVLLATIPPQSPTVTKTGLEVKVADGTLSVIQRDIPLLTVPAEALATCSAVRIDSTATQTGAQVVGGTIHTVPVHQDVRPQVVGIFSEVPKDQLHGFTAHAGLDTRFTTSPTWIKLTAMVFAVLLTIISLLALHRLDLTDDRGNRRFLPAHWLHVSVADVVVIGVLLVWHFIGSNTSDDGYILTMARASEHSGYLANYYRWFGVPEAPFGWPDHVLAWLTKISDMSPFVRLVALIPAIVCWLVISREVLPRLGTAVRNSKLALWTAGLVLLAFWLPYDNGLRPEPLIAMGALLTWCFIERAIATGRLFPAAIAVLIAAFSLAAGPTGLICVAALLAGSRPVLQILIRRARGDGLKGFASLLAPGLAAGVVVLTVVFAGPTLPAAIEATRVRQLIGPNVAWFDEYTRWTALLTMTPDGSVARRFGVFVMVLMLLVCVMQVLRKGGRIPGAAVGPTNRLLGITFASILLAMFTPTKWTHHFGAYAGLAASLAALGAVAVSADGIRSRRNRALFAAAVSFVLAMTFVGTNGWWYVSSYGIPWWDKPVSLHGKGLSTAFLGLTGLALLVALWHHYREPYQNRRRQVAAKHMDSWTITPRARTEKQRLAARFIPAPLTLAAAFVVLFELASFAKGAVAQRHSYSIAGQNFSAVSGYSCALADKVLVETDPNAAMLSPVVSGAGFTAQSIGFSATGVAPDLTADVLEKPTGGANNVDTKGEDKTSATNEGTGSGKTLPFGLATTTPVMGSYAVGEKKPASFTSTWYRLDRPSGAKLLVIAAAGRIKSVDASGVVTYGQDVMVEYGKTMSGGEAQVLGRIMPMDVGPAPSWRNLRVPLSQIPANANAVRLVVASNDLTTRQWVAVTPPRVPTMRTLESVVGTQPALLDWHVPLQFPCQHPFDHRDGVAEVPVWRILPDRVGADVANHWQDAFGGGPLGWTGLLLNAETVPTYLDDDWRRDWGSLQKFTPLDPGATPAHVDVTVETRSGLEKYPPMLIR